MIEEDQFKRIIDTKCIYCGKKIKTTYYYYEIDSTIVEVGEYRIDDGICDGCYRKLKKELLEGFKNDK